MMNRKTKFARPFKRAALVTALAAAFCRPDVAGAFEFDTGNPDLSVRWDNSIQYNLGIRARNCDPNICGNGRGAGDLTATASDRKFGKAGDVITNRISDLSEFDFIYKDHWGFRVSGNVWYDEAYHNASAAPDPAFGALGLSQLPNNQYTDYIKRWNRGPSGQLLDAFAFGRVNAGNVPIDIKVGQHNIYWGESVFSFVGGVADGQGPVDVRTALTAPGTEAKALFLPTNQISFTAQLTNKVTLAGEYYLGWKPAMLPDGGTYFGAADFLTLGGGTLLPFIGPGVTFNGTQRPKNEMGDWGIALKVRPEWLDGSAGFYYRDYTNKFPQLVMNSPTSAVADYTQPRQQLIGFSLSKDVAGVSVGTDITYRRNAMLGATPFAPVFLSTGQGDWHPQGNVFTALVNAIAYFGKTPLFDSATLIGELTYSNLLRVTNDPYKLFLGLPQNCGAGTSTPGVAIDHGCPTKQAYGLGVQFMPIWYSVFNGVDLKMPIFFSIGLHGNSPVPFGDNQGQGAYSIGLTADVRQKYTVSLAYNGFIARHSNDSAGILSNSNASLGKYWDRNWISLTFKATF
ncbi:hypothetical protein PTE30175_01774 [Pandoraea terrae]|uniref:DUF1302 domain-containing protein n=1 Tax=Pandoraea terrae TaxID=1537710 RepID=A0A5E4U8M3_9BURK|nr:DUF1302 family protein [Pandoraea terrae]VVD95368.1 hypothetical protein PTE30175_01774 [Pandoraea terrae]